MKKLLVCTAFVLFAVQLLCAQVLLPPKYTAVRTKSGFLYSFTVKRDCVVKYRVFDAFTGTVATGELSDNGRLSVNHNDTVTAWTETLAGTRSREITLSKQETEVNAANRFDVVSPAEGTWANRQALVVQAASGTEVYYSFSGSNPLEFGFAYDGPVLIDAVGEVTLNVVALHADGTTVSKNITYTVRENANKPPLAVSDMNPLVLCGMNHPVTIPADALYSLGESDVFLRGTTIQTRVPSCIDVCLPLTVSYNGADYRYVIQTADSPRLESGTQMELSSPIQIVDWNFVMFQENTSVQYCVDGGEWVLYTEPFFLERTRTHTIYWKTAESTQKLELPPKPTVTGVPRSLLTNNCVELQCSNALYTFRIEKGGLFSPPLTSFYVDTLLGDVLDVDVRLALYYGNIRQGDVALNFTVDKQPPLVPVIRLAPHDEYERDSVTAFVSSPDSVYVAVTEEKTQFDFYDSRLTENEVPTLTKESQTENLSFVPLSSSRLVLTGDEFSAVDYTVYAYALDKAGNKSDTVCVKTFVDRNNFYVDANPFGRNASYTDEHYKEDGTANNPFSSVVEAFRTVNSRENTVLHIRGSFTDLPSILLLSNCTVMGRNGARLTFAPKATLTVKNGTVHLNDIGIEKNALPSDEDSAITDITETGTTDSPLLHISGARVVAKNCDFSCNGSKNAVLLNTEGATLFLLESSLSMSADFYALAVRGQKSNVYGNNVNVSLASDSAVGFSLTESVFELTDTKCLIVAKRARGAELYGCTYKLNASVRQTQNEGDAQKYVSLWKDANSTESSAPLFSADAVR